MIRVAALALALAGCATSLGPIGMIRPDAEAVGVKVLRPGVSGRACRASIVGLQVSGTDAELREALRPILALDAEGDVVVNAEVRWHQFVTGVYNRRCVEVRGDLARTISTITLPAPPGHHGH